jgi:hypothetical protein
MVLRSQKFWSSLDFILCCNSSLMYIFSSICKLAHSWLIPSSKWEAYPSTTSFFLEDSDDLGSAGLWRYILMYGICIIYLFCPTSIAMLMRYRFVTHVKISDVLSFTRFNTQKRHLSERDDNNINSWSNHKFFFWINRHKGHFKDSLSQFYMHSGWKTCLHCNSRIYSYSYICIKQILHSPLTSEYLIGNNLSFSSLVRPPLNWLIGLNILR